MSYKAIVSNCPTDWTGTWVVVDENYKTISTHCCRELAEREAERMNDEN